MSCVPEGTPPEGTEGRLKSSSSLVIPLTRSYLQAALQAPNGWSLISHSTTIAETILLVKSMHVVWRLKSTKMERSDAMAIKQSKFAMIFELVELGERAFVFKLKKMNPLISPEGVEAAVRAWYQDRPGAALGDGVGEPGDIGRFNRCENSNK